MIGCAFDLNLLLSIATGRLESLEVLMQNDDLNKDGNIAFQEAQFLWERGAEMQIFQQSFTAADADTNNVPDSGELVQCLASIGRPKSFEVFMQNYDLSKDGNV